MLLVIVAFYFGIFLNEAIGQLAMANSVCWYGHMLRREDGHVLRRVFDFEVEGQRKKGRPKRTWRKQGSVKVDQSGLLVLI